MANHATEADGHADGTKSDQGTLYSKLMYWDGTKYVSNGAQPQGSGLTATTAGNLPQAIPDDLTHGPARGAYYVTV